MDFRCLGGQKVSRRMAADGGGWDGSRTPIIPLLDDSMMACWRIPWIDDVMSGWWSDECGWRMVWIVNGEWWIDDWNDWMEGLLTRSSYIMCKINFHFFFQHMVWVFYGGFDLRDLSRTTQNEKLPLKSVQTPNMNFLKPKKTHFVFCSWFSRPRNQTNRHLLHFLHSTWQIQTF